MHEYVTTISTEGNNEWLSIGKIKNNNNELLEDDQVLATLLLKEFGFEIPSAYARVYIDSKSKLESLNKILNYLGYPAIDNNNKKLAFEIFAM